MSRTIDAATIAAIQNPLVRWVVIVRIETPSLTLKMTSGSNDIVYNSETYTPGTLGAISPVTEQGLNNSAVGITFSGVDLSTLAAAASQDFLNSPVMVRIIPHDDDWLPVGDGILLFDGFTSDAPSISYGSTSEVGVTCKGKFAALDRARSERYSDAEQQRKYPGDLGMQYAASVANKEVIWPASSFFESD